MKRKLEKIEVLKAHTQEEPLEKSKVEIGIATVHNEDHLIVQCPECHCWIYIPIGSIKGLFVFRNPQRGVV